MEWGLARCAGEQQSRMGNQQVTVVHKMAHWQKEKRRRPPGFQESTARVESEDKHTHTTQ